MTAKKMIKWNILPKQKWDVIDGCGIKTVEWHWHNEKSYQQVRKKLIVSYIPSAVIG